LFEGPDFQDADFELDGKIYHGDVEIHRTTKEWYHHHHHLDRRYNAVQLHLVWQDQPDVQIYTSEKRKVITLDIKTLSPVTGHQFYELKCQAREIKIDNLYNKLENLSFERLKYKTTRIKNLVTYTSYDQAIYLLVMRTLGSPNNSLNFEYFASSLPWEDIMKVRNRKQLSAEDWVRFLLSISGLEKTKRAFARSSGNYYNYQLISKSPQLSRIDWQCSGQRPQNHPARHFNILGKWIYAFPDDSMYFGLKNIFMRRESVNNLIKNMENFFSLSIPRLKGQSRRDQYPSQDNNWGRSKIIELIGNALVPFFYWESIMTSSFGFQEYLKDIYLTLPQTNKYSKLKIFEKIFPEKDNKGQYFYKYQGLLYLHQQYCQKNECKYCPLIDNHKEIDKNSENI
jgi:hypothetical protein